MTTWKLGSLAIGIHPPQSGGQGEMAKEKFACGQADAPVALVVVGASWHTSVFFLQFLKYCIMRIIL
jgi:hypothetical protein